MLVQGIVQENILTFCRIEGPLEIQIIELHYDTFP